MKKISSLGLGDQFQVAHPEQRSANNRPMPRSQVFEVAKIFVQSPHYVIAKSPGADGIFSLPPDAVVLAVGEPTPMVKDIEEFLEVKVKARVVGYRLLWDGRLPLGPMSSKAEAVAKMLVALGKEMVYREQITEIVERHLAKFYKGKGLGSATFFAAARELAARGLMEEILDRGAVPEEFREAGISVEGRNK